MTAPQTGQIPAWSLADRLRKARKFADLSQIELADQMGIARASVANYENARTTPSRPVLLSWALTCGVSLEWLAGSPHPGPAKLSDTPDVRKPGRCLPSRVLAGAAA